MTYSCCSIDGTTHRSGDEEKGKPRDEGPSKAYQRIQPLIKCVWIRLEEDNPEGVHRHAERPPRVRLHESAFEVRIYSEWLLRYGYYLHVYQEALRPAKRRVLTTSQSIARNNRPNASAQIRDACKHDKRISWIAQPRYAPIRHENQRYSHEAD